jgi:CubicO group peptidase (beta-lactamase class C family)
MERHTQLDSIADARFRALCAAAVQAMERLHVPGVAIGVADGNTEHIAGFGVTNVDHPLPVDGDTLFQIGSTSKTITGTMAMCLAERGLLDLDAPIRTYLPELRLADEQTAAGVTLRHLFNHTGGWAGDYFDDLGPGDGALARIVAKMADLPQLTPLGTIWSYNNAGFYLAGRALEVVGGKPFEALAHELVLAPLGMDHSFFFPGDIMTYRFAAGHMNSFVAGEPPARVARPWPLARTAHPAGGISSTARDQLRYARFHMGDGRASDGTRLLAPTALAAMQTPTVAAANGEQMGATWFVRDIGGTRVLRHGGATLGQKSAFVFVPARQFAVTVLTNADRGGELHQEITQLALKLFLGLEDQPPAPSSLAEPQLAEYAGRYRALLADCELISRDGELILYYLPNGGFPAKDSPAPPAPPAVRLAGCGPDQVIALDEPFQHARGEFLRGPAGEIVWFRFGGRVHRRAG